MGRFRTGEGELVPLTNLWSLPRSLAQAIERKLSGRIPRLPWIPFSAIRRLETIITPESRVWEIGAGYSTLWLAARSSHVTSTEADQTWFDRLSRMIAEESIANIDLRYEWRGDQMSNLTEAQETDLFFIDGGPRLECLRNALAVAKPGAFIYCDNMDNHTFFEPTALRALLRQYSSKIASTETFVDYVPAMVGVFKGTLFKLHDNS